MGHNNIFHFGVKDNMSPFQKRTVTLSNQISLIFFLILIALTALQVFKMKEYIPAAVFGGVAVFLLIVPFLNKFGFTKFTSFFISIIIPSAIVAASIFAKLNSSGNIDLIFFIAPRILLIGTLVIPLVLIDYRDYGIFISTIVIHLIAIGGYSEIQKLFGVGMEKAIYVPDTYIITTIVSVLAMLTLLISFIFFQRINVKHENNIIKEKEASEQHRKELALQQEETEKINQELFTQRLLSEETKIELQKQSKAQEKLNQELFAQRLEVEQASFELKRQSKQQEKLNQELFAQTLEVEQKNIEIKRSYKNLELLGTIGKKIISKLSVEDIIRSSFINIKDLMDITLFAVGIYDSNNERIVYPGTIKDNQKLPMYFYELTKPNSFSVWCYKNKDEIFINDLEKEYGKYLESYPDLKAFKAQSFIYCPLFRNEETIGTVTVHHENKNAFTEQNLFIMRNIATYISLALQNAESYKQIKEQLKEINDKNIMVNSSLNYAKTIQQSMLPSEQKLNTEYNTELVFFPRDIVSGDFYWTANIFNKRKFVAAIDCTGHGVPGAFLSFVGSKSLDEIVHSKQIFEPKKILDALDDNIKEILNQEHSNNRDGMDVAMCAIEETKSGKIKVIFTGAKLPLFYYQKKDNIVHYIKGSRKAIGGGYFDNQEFEQHELLLEKGDILYIATDGYIDQDAKEHKRFGRQRFIGMLEKIASFPLPKQRVFMKQIFNKYKGDSPQRDDVTVLITEL